MNKLQLQDHFFKMLIDKKIMPIQSRYIAYKLIEDFKISSFIFISLQSESFTIETEKNERYKIELLEIDVPANSIIKI
jgi:hypothetical protein